MKGKVSFAAGMTPSEMEPVYTFRGHSGAVLCMDVSPTGDRLFTGGLDGVICCSAVPSGNVDPYDVYGKCLLSLREQLEYGKYMSSMRDQLENFGFETRKGISTIVSPHVFIDKIN